MLSKRISLFLGPILFVLIQLIEFHGLSPEGKSVLAVTAWVAVWWVGEATSLAITSLLPILLLPLSGGLTMNATTSAYGHPFIFLFMGGLMMGLAIEKCGLHKRIAFGIVKAIGSSEKRIIVGFMIATAFMSMWISNTATAVMMYPIGLSIIHEFKAEGKFSKNLMLGIAYAASIGGMATLIGTPPNIILAGVASDLLHIDISFMDWMLFALPFATTLLIATIIYLTSYKIEPNSKTISLDNTAIDDLGKISSAEKRVLLIFVLVALFWITRSFIWEKLIPGLDDTSIAIAGAVLMFLVPSGEKKEFLLDWNTAKELPWSVLLIFGAGLAIAAGFSTTDLSEWLGNQFLSLQSTPNWVVLFLVIAGINFLTEVTSNTATASMVLPIMVTLGASLSIPPITLMIGAALASSCAYMLPVSTPPNAIVFASGQITIKQMVTTGFALNWISIFLIYLFVTYWWPIVG